MERNELFAPKRNDALFSCVDQTFLHVVQFLRFKSGMETKSFAIFANLARMSKLFCFVLRKQEYKTKSEVKRLDVF